MVGKVLDLMLDVAICLNYNDYESTESFIEFYSSDSLIK